MIHLSPFINICTKSDSNSDAHQAIDAFFSSLEFPSSSEDQKHILNLPLSKEEILKAINGMDSGKSPGPDGLGVEFYREFENLLVDSLLDIYNDSFKEGPNLFA